jgi:hypothetical protein
MILNRCSASASGARPIRRLLRSTPLLRYAALIVACGVSTSCGRDVALEDPHTGKIEVCRESWGGLNPWSQTMSCVEDHVAQGWTISGQE